MAVTRTTRFSLHRWDSGTDPFNREQSDSDNLQLETLSAVFRSGLDAAKGSASASNYARSFYLATDTSPATLYWSDGTNWVTVNLVGSVSDIQSLAIGSTASAGTSTTSSGVTTQKYALANHVHAMPSAAAPIALGTALAAGTAATISRSDHVHTIGAGAITSATMFAAGAVDANALATSAVTTGKIADANVTTVKIADANVTTAKIADANVTGVKIASAVAGSGLQQNATTKALEAKTDNSTIGVNASGQIYLISTGNASSIPDNSITTAKMVDANVTTAKLAAASVTAAKIAADIAGNGLAQAVGGALDVSVDSSTIEINADIVRVKDAGITAAKIASGAVTTAKLDTTAGSEAVTTATIRDANVTTAKVADANITGAKLASAVAGSGLQQNVTSKALEVKTDGSTIGINASGQVYLVSTGGTSSIADASVTTAKLVDANVTTAKIADLNVTTAKIADLNVTTGKIADLGVTTAKIAASAITEAKIASSAFNVAGALDGGNTGTATSTLAVRVDNSTIYVNSTNNLAIKNGGVTSAQLLQTAGSEAVITAAIRDLNVTTAKIADLNVTTGKIADLAVTAGKIASSAISTTGGLTGGAGTALAVNVDGTTIAIASNTLGVAALGIGTNQLAAGAVTGAKAGAGTYRNITSPTTGGQIKYGTVASAPTSATGYTNGDLYFGY